MTTQSTSRTKCERKPVPSCWCATQPLSHPWSGHLRSSLALNDMQYTTPWITIADGKGRFLSHLDLQLTAAGAPLSALSWQTQYVLEAPPEHITLRMVWEQADELNVGLALDVLFGVCAIITLALLWLTCARYGDAAIAEILTEDDRPPPSHATSRDRQTKPDPRYFGGSLGHHRPHGQRAGKYPGHGASKAD